MLHVLYDQHVISTQANTTMVSEFRSLFFYSKSSGMCLSVALSVPPIHMCTCAHTQCNTPDVEFLVNVLFFISLLKVLKLNFIKYVMIYHDQSVVLSRSCV